MSIVIVVIIIVIGEAELVLHSDGIIAQIAFLTINFENEFNSGKLEKLSKRIYPKVVVHP